MLIVSYKQDHMDAKKSLVQKYSKVFTLSAWSFVLVVSTVGMALFGLWLDKICGTQPFFMAGLMVLANGTTMWRLYLEAKIKK